MMSCHVSTLRKRKYDGAHNTTSVTHNAKNHARDTNRSATVANRSNRDNSARLTLRQFRYAS
jgi:hypothetical protein